MRKPGLLDDGANLVFHCGEPLAVPIDFYRKGFEFLDRLNPGPKPINVCFSTNATLLDQSWCDLIKARGNIRMRISIDGPKWLHDSARVERSGRGTFDRVTRGIKLLQANDIPFDVLCVVTERTLGAAEEMWNFFRAINATSVGFCVEEVLGDHSRSSLQFDMSVHRIRQFFETWMRLRDEQDLDYYLRELDEITAALSAGNDDSLVRPDNVPLSLISIAWDGSICLFSPELLTMKHPVYGDFVLGNVATHTIEDILNSPKFQRLYEAITEGVHMCRRDCKYFKVCGGGFPVSKLIENGRFESTETLTCKLRIKAVTDVVVTHFNRKRTQRMDDSLAAAMPRGRALNVLTGSL
jgi:uncharacterized protein